MPSLLMPLTRPRWLLAVAIVVSGPAHAGMETDSLFPDLAPLDHAELGESRGGMMINGIPMNFSVLISTTVEGAVSQGLQTLLTVDDHGALGSAVTTPIGGNTGVTTNADGGLSLSLPSGTTIVHQVLAGQVQALIANVDNGVNLNQRAEVNVDLPGFSALTQTWYSNSRTAQMGVSAALNGLGHR